MKNLPLAQFVLILIVAGCSSCRKSSGSNENLALANRDQQEINADTSANANRSEHLRQHQVSGGIMNAKAVSLPQPPYPPAARKAKVRGDVMVQILVDENGKVIAAQSVSGHRLLRAAAKEAALKATFKPMLIGDIPPKVSGVLTFTFPAPVN